MDSLAHSLQVVLSFSLFGDEVNKISHRFNAFIGIDLNVEFVFDFVDDFENVQTVSIQIILEVGCQLDFFRLLIQLVSDNVFVP